MRPPADDADFAHWFAVRRGEILVAEGPHGFAIPHGKKAPIDHDGRHTLGSLAGSHVWALDVPTRTDEPEGHVWVPLRQLYGKLDDIVWTMAGRAEQIVSWDRTHRFCGRCGTETVTQPAERARRCPSCGQLAFPRLSPAIITLVTRGQNDEEVLLAHGRQFPGRFYSALAGFVEPGESLEECVVREVKEEVGIDVDNVRYFGSQPWPFPHSLMIGFMARYVSGDLVLQEEEIVDAGWYRADDLPPSPRGGMSIAGWLIEDWLSRR